MLILVHASVFVFEEAASNFRDSRAEFCGALDGLALALPKTQVGTRSCPSRTSRFANVRLFIINYKVIFFLIVFISAQTFLVLSF